MGGGVVVVGGGVDGGGGEFCRMRPRVKQGEVYARRH